MGQDRGGDAAGYLGWFFLGAVAGAVATALMTPKSGREARAFLSEHGNEWLKLAQERAGETQEKAGDLFDKGQVVRTTGARDEGQYDAQGGSIASEQKMGRHIRLLGRDPAKTSGDGAAILRWPPTIGRPTNIVWPSS